jgi:hypothetical protein
VLLAAAPLMFKNMSYPLEASVGVGSPGAEATKPGEPLKLSKMHAWRKSVWSNQRSDHSISERAGAGDVLSLLALCVVGPAVARRCVHRASAC